MKQMVVFSLMCAAALASDFQSAKILEVRSFPMPAGTSATVAVVVAGMTYVADVDDFKADSLAAGDSVSARIVGSSLFVKRADGTMIKAKIRISERLQGEFWPAQQGVKHPPQVKAKPYNGFTVRVKSVTTNAHGVRFINASEERPVMPDAPARALRDFIFTCNVDAPTCETPAIEGI